MSNNNKKYTKLGQDIILTPENYTKVLLWLPGVGDVPESYKDLFITDSIIPNDVKVIILNPPIKPFTLSENKSITNWFDVYKPGFHDKSYYNFDDVSLSSNRIIKIIKNEAKKIGDYNKIYIGGFSQGACMALYICLGINFKIGGGIICSGFLFPQMEINEENKDIKIFIGHGTDDNVIGYNIAKNSYEKILGFNNIIFKTYEHMGHTIDNLEFDEIKKFLS